MDYKRLLATLTKYRADKNNKHTLKLSIDTLTSMGKFVAAIPRENFFSHLKGDGVVIASDGETMDRAQVASFIGIICTFPTSFFMTYKGAMVNNPKFSSPVPYILYMHKIHNGTMYNEWQDSNPIILGPHFKDLQADAYQIGAEALSWSVDDKMKLREKALVWAGKVVPATGWALVKTQIDNEFDSLSKATRMMILQTWCHNGANRTKYMINDPLDWDLLPDALDEMAQRATKPGGYMASLGELPWET